MHSVPRGVCHHAVFRAAGRGIGHVRHVGVDDAVVLDVSPVEVDEEGSLLAQRAAYVAVELQRMVGRLIERKGIGGVKDRSAGIHEDLAVQFVGARLGQYLDPAITRRVIVGGNGILVNNDGADRRLGR